MFRIVLKLLTALTMTAVASAAVAQQRPVPQGAFDGSGAAGNPGRAGPALRRLRLPRRRAVPCAGCGTARFRRAPLPRSSGRASC